VVYNLSVSDVSVHCVHMVASYPIYIGFVRGTRLKLHIEHGDLVASRVNSFIKRAYTCPGNRVYIASTT
jgi:hypothetical protein